MIVISLFIIASCSKTNKVKLYDYSTTTKVVDDINPIR